MYVSKKYRRLVYDGLGSLYKHYATELGELVGRGEPCNEAMIKEYNNIIDSLNLRMNKIQIFRARMERHNWIDNK